MGNDSAGVLSLEEEHRLGRGPRGILILGLTLKSRAVLPKLHGAGLQCSLCETGGTVKLVFPEYWKHVI